MKFISLLSALFLATVLPMSAQDKVEKPVPNQKTVTEEPLGSLALGQTEKEVIKILGKPESKSKKQVMGATGTSFQTWFYPAKGLTLTMELGNLKMVQATEGCTLATARGIKIGSTEAAVKKAYAKERSKLGSTPGKSFLAGSLYDGVNFTFKAGKVSEIFLGVTAE